MIEVYTIGLEKAVVQLTDSLDEVTLFTNLTANCPKISDQSILRASVEHDTGVSWVKENFGIEPEVINQRRGL